MINAIAMGEAKVGVLLAVSIFDQFFKELFRVEEGLSNFTVTSSGIDVDIALNPPTFLLVPGEQGQDPRTQLHLTGTAETEILGATQTFDLDIKIFLDFVLVETEGQPPALGLAYGGVAEELDPPISAEDIDGLFKPGSTVGDRLSAIRIDVVSPIIEGLEPIFFPEDGEEPVPEPGAWEPKLRLMPAATEGEMDAFGIFVARPGENADPGEVPSWMPLRTGFCLVYSRDLLDFVLQAGADEKIGTKICGATVNKLDLHMDDLNIVVDGEVEQLATKIPFDGPIHPHLIRGSTSMFMDTSGVHADPPPGLAGFLRFLGVLTSFIPIANIWTTPKVWELAEKLDNAPSLIQGGLASALGPELQKLAEGLTVETELETITLESTPDTLMVRSGCFLFAAQVFVSQIVEEIFLGYYSNKVRRFVLFRMNSGRKFRASELARLVGHGKIVTPGFHDVDGRYMRANPDDENANNLLHQFKETMPDEISIDEAIADEASSDEAEC